MIAQRSISSTIVRERPSDTADGFVDRPRSRRERDTVLNEIMCSRTLQPNSKAVAWVLDMYCSPKNLCVWPSQGLIAKKLGIPERSVQRAVAQLVTEGYVKVRTSDCPCGRSSIRRSNHYQMRALGRTDLDFYEDRPDYPTDEDVFGPTAPPAIPYPDPKSSPVMTESGANPTPVSSLGASGRAPLPDTTVGSNPSPVSGRTYIGNRETTETSSPPSPEYSPSASPTESTVHPAPKPQRQAKKRRSGLRSYGPTYDEPRYTSITEPQRTPIPENWAPTLEQVGAALDLGLDPNRAGIVAENFRDWHRGRGTRAERWDSLWLKWCRDEVDRTRERLDRRGARAKLADRLEELAQDPGLGGKLTYLDRF